MTTAFFYQNLKGFSRFSAVVSDRHFHAVPSDWLIVVTDVKSSTKAIEAGRYKEVNMIGAASIVAAHNVMGDLSFPYVFGGDGTVFLIPSEYEKQMSEELSSLQSLSMSQFGLALRAGIVSVREILEAGATLEVAKFSLTDKKFIAFFRGGGVSLAEDRVKANEEKYRLSGNKSYSPNLEKLSCRWKPIPSKNGKVVSLLVMSQKNNEFTVYQHIIAKLMAAIKGSIDSVNPVNLPDLEYKGLLDCYKAERSLHASVFSLAFIKRLFSIGFSVFIFNFGFLKRYRNTLKTHSDYRKFDDMLRMVIDCDSEQANDIRFFLEEMFQSGEIYYGVHESDNSLITCFLDSTEEGEHIHFIDGDDGGYAMAAKSLKEQMRKVNETSEEE